MVQKIQKDGNLDEEPLHRFGDSFDIARHVMGRKVVLTLFFLYASKFCFILLFSYTATCSLLTAK